MSPDPLALAFDPFSYFNCNMKGFAGVVGAVLLAGMLASCTSDGPVPASNGNPPTSEPISMQMSRAVPDLRGQRRTDLLYFEAPTDSVFVIPSNLQMEADNTRAHTGKTSLKLRGNSGKLTVKLASLLGD